ncbi:putative Polycomb group protein ASXL1 isoform X1 [Pimephales promelas]|uniref:putative Polycomb group protein ASXL1 isoform X1 n=1 Tax=Pimephales promelas TaxID=90988 RepID=UPI001955D9F0|nr:putative Polycomb group protein ASXL1 isoform X1 [Pimephales promelas]KAG1961133.1 polycomb group protein ASXL1 [Pimephales promelas]
MKDKQKRKKERTWAEAARMVLENFSDAPMTPKQILHVIQTKGLKEMRSGTAPLACLVTMLHSQVRGDRVKNSIFFKLPGRMSLFTLKKNALQWTKSPTANESGDGTGTSTGSTTATVEGAEQESCDSTEATAASGENDASVDETSSSASCSTEPQTRLSRSSQSGRQRKKAVMMPRVVLTPLKVNGEHVPSGAAGRRREGSRGGPGPTLRARSELGWKRTQHFKSIRGLRSGPMKRNRGGVEVDFETPGSILVNTNIRALINTRTFAAFPPHSQQQLLQLLPEVDRQVGPDGLARLSSSALNNEFFTHASQSWKERLAEGEFTHEMQVRFRQEMEKEKKVEAWKEKFFEEYHGQRSGLTREESLKLTMSDAGDVAGAVLDSDSATVATPKRRSVGRRRREGRIRRRSRADLRRRARRSLCKNTTATLPSEETTESTATPDVIPLVASPVPEATAVQAEVVLQTDIGLEAPEENLSAEAVPSPVPVPTPPPESTSSTCDEPEASTGLLPEVPEPAVASTSSPSSSSSSTSSSSSPSSSPSSASDRQTFAASSDSSSSSSSSTAAVATDPLDDGASVITTGTAGTGASSRESSPAASPATSSPAIQLKEQKRRPDESQAFTSFPEKRARLDERQSFRNTVDCVHSEKPQPTTEEPKVPPIRIQLSRIKPPWVKGPPTYQICPRIVPPNEGSRRSGTGARTLADIKARAQQARAQREAAAAVAASGDGGGPGGSGPGGGTGIPDRSSGRRSREHPGPVEPGGGGGGRRGGRVDLEEQESPASSHSSGTQLQLSSVDSADRPQTSTPLTEPSPSSVSSNPSLPPSESPKTLTLSPPATDSPTSQDQVEEICGEEEMTACPSDKASEQTLDTPVPTPSDPESFCSHQDPRGEEAESSESRTTTPICTSASNDAISLVPTSIPDSLPRFGAQGVDVIRTLAASQPWEGEKNGGELHPGTTGVIQHGSDLKMPKETLVTARNGWVESSEEHSMREGMLQEHSNGESDADGKYESGSLPCLPSNAGEEDTGAHSDSTETASDFENETQEDETVDWHETQMDLNGMHAQNTKSQNHPVIQTSSRLASSMLNPPQHQQPVIQAHISNPNHTQTVIQARFPNGVPNQPVIHSHKQHTIHTHAINHAQEQITTAPSQAQVQAYLTQAVRDQSRPLRLNDNGNDVKLFVSTEDDTKPLSRGPGEDFVLNAAGPPVGRRFQGSSRPVSSVEANNPLVTQLLQGSLPLEKVLPQPHSVSKLDINRLPGSPVSNSASRQPPRNLGPRFRGPSESGGPIETGVSDFQQKSPSVRVSPGPGRNFGSSPPSSAPSRMACLFEEASPRTTNVQFSSQQPGGAVPSGAVPVITSLPSNSSARTSMDMNSQNAPVYESAVIKEHPGPLPPRGENLERPAGFQQHPNNLSQSVCRTAPDAPSPPHGELCPSEVVPTVKINWRPSKPQPPQHQTYQQQLSPIATIKNEVSSRPSCQQALTKNSPAPIIGNTSVVITKKEPLDSFHGGGGAMEGLLNMEMSLVRMAKKEQVRNPYARQADTSASPVSSSPSSSASSLPYQLYSKLPKLQQSGGNGGSSSSFSYTANVSVVDGSGFSRSLADGVLQIRPRVSVSSGGGQSATLSIQAFADSAAEEVALKCSCRLKAMIMCQGCGAFCHDDCIGPSKLCVSCLVVR